MVLYHIALNGLETEYYMWITYRIEKILGKKDVSRKQFLLECINIINKNWTSSGLTILRVLLLLL